PANVAAANAAEPIPRTLLLEKPSCIPLPFFSSLIASLSLWIVNSTTLVLCSSTSKKHARCQSSMDWNCRKINLFGQLRLKLPLDLAQTMSFRLEEHTSELQSPDQLVCRLL